MVRRGWTVTFALGASVVAVALHVPARAGPANERVAPVLPDARDVYLRDCAFCHGSSGEGSARGPGLQEVGRASAHYWISTGRMPIDDPGDQIERKEPAYPPELVDPLVEYVADLGPGGLDIPEVDLAQADVADGGELFLLHCAACHAWSGVGGALLHREAPPVQPASPTQIAEAVRIGPGEMPAFGQAALSDRELNDVVAYTQYLDDPQDRGGHPIWHLGPLAEGAIAWVIGVGALLLVTRWIGERG